MATGMSFAEAAGLTRAQLTVLQKAMIRQWKMTAMTSGFGTLGGKIDPEEDEVKEDPTAIFERKVAMLKRQTGRQSFDLWEIV